MDQYKAFAKAWLQMVKRKHSKGQNCYNHSVKKENQLYRKLSVLEKSKLTIAFRAWKQNMIANFIL